MTADRGRSLLSAARRSRGLTQDAVARRAGTTQSTLSAYERGTKSPTLAVVERILGSIGFDLALESRITFREIKLRSGRGTALVADRLWRLEPVDCFAPLTVDDDGGRQFFDTTDVDERAQAYVWLLHHGNETQLAEHLDAALFADLWPRIVERLDRAVVEAWWPMVLEVLNYGFDDYLIGSLRADRPKTLGRRARLALINRLAAHGLSADEIRDIIPTRRSDVVYMAMKRRPWRW